MTDKNTCPASCLDEMYTDLNVKAALDADATVRLIEALEEVFAGRDANEALASAGLTGPSPGLPGKPPLELAAETAALRTLAGVSPGLRRIAELRDSLYRYQSLYS